MAARTSLGAPLVIWVEAQEAEAAIMRLNETLSPPSVAGFMTSIVEPYIKDRASSRFASQGDDASGEWAPLQPSTIEIRQAQGFPPGPINVRTGELRDFIINNEGELALTETGVTWSYPADVGIEEELYQKLLTAQKGAKQKFFRDTPARPVLAVAAADEAFISESLMGFILARQGLEGGIG